MSAVDLVSFFRPFAIVDVLRRKRHTTGRRHANAWCAMLLFAGYCCHMCLCACESHYHRLVDVFHRLVYVFKVAFRASQEYYVISASLLVCFATVRRSTSTLAPHVGQHHMAVQIAFPTFSATSMVELRLTSLFRFGTTTNTCGRCRTRINRTLYRCAWMECCSDWYTSPGMRELDRPRLLLPSASTRWWFTW